MEMPQDCPLWVEKIFNDLESKSDVMLRNSKTSDDALKASGAYGLWMSAKEEIALEAVRQAQEIRQRNIQMNARQTAH